MFGWVNGITRKWVWFCGRFCASKYINNGWEEISPATFMEATSCALCGRVR